MNRANTSRVLVIAEAGVNHNGRHDLAFELVEAAAATGADAVKFQTFKTENEISRRAKKADYQKLTTDAEESQFDMVKRLELSYEFHHELRARCEQCGIRFLSSGFDLESVEFLVREMCLDLMKIPSGEITNAPLLLANARAGCRQLISTGMANMEEVEEALGVMAFGFLGADCEPSRPAFREAFRSLAGQAQLRKKVTLLHCTTEYPAPLADVNLRAMATMRERFALPVGYSDHSAGITVPIAAVALGATVIEKHFTTDRGLPGPDHQASLEPGEFKTMVDGIRAVELALGDGRKVARGAELRNRDIARKSLVATTDIVAGERLTRDNVTAKRPGTGIPPMEFWNVLGTVAVRDYQTDELLD